MRKVEVIGYKIAKKTYHEFESLTHAAEHCKAAVESIYLVCQGKFKQTKGWCFVYKSENFAEEIQSKLSQQTTINWFKFINFAGTPQDAEHLRGLS